MQIIHQPEGKSHRQCSPSHHTISAHIPCEHTACVDVHQQLHIAYQHGNTVSSCLPQETYRSISINYVYHNSQIMQVPVTLREPEHPHGDSMVVHTTSSSSSWQILHCIIR
jgi:hypothetical protein